MLTVLGTVSLDTLRTPTKTLVNTLGGSVSFASVCASYFAKTALVGIAGTDFPVKYRNLLARYADIRGLEIRKGKTFRYDARYSQNLESRKTLRIVLGVTKYPIKVPEMHKKSRFVYLANNNPSQTLKALSEFDSPKFTMCDTIDLWINTKRRALLNMIKKTNATVINYEEAQMLTKERDMLACCKKIESLGATYVIIKKDEHGAVLYHEGELYPYAGFPATKFVDPTGAGDSFAGAVMGYLESKNSTSLSNMRRAVAYGIITGAMAVEKHGIMSVLGKNKKEIDRRLKRYERITRF